MSYYLGIDTSNYTTSVSLFCDEDNTVINNKIKIVRIIKILSKNTQIWKLLYFIIKLLVQIDKKKL